ncbi:MAG: aspartate aminotransferase family protein [Chloroflexi bacterium]|nr:aspartate aminotransferase family protein [Chloroflexota bacterium]
MNIFDPLFLSRTQKSKAMFERASRRLPGGVAGNGKFLRPYPIYVGQAQGGEFLDVDGNRYVDLLMGAGVHILGHSPEVVMSAVEGQLRKGAQYYMAAEAEVLLAEKICYLMPHVEMVRFVNTGSEATQMALRAARAYRKRDKIAKFEGNFHGQHEAVLISTLGAEGEADAPSPRIDSAGVPASTRQGVLVLPYNDAGRAAALIEAHADELGAVILEPVSAFGLGVAAAEPDFLQAVRDVTAKHGIPLIFDEIVTNFRLGLGGATEYFGVTPDLVCLGKIVGGGFAIGGYGGRREIMDQVVTPRTGLWNLSEQIFQSGCFSGNPISMMAGLAVLTELEKGQVHPYINRIAERLQIGLTEIGERLGFPILVNRAASCFQVHFGVERIRNKRDQLCADKKIADLFHYGLRAHGVMASSHPLFISAAHTDQHVGVVLEAAERVLEQMRDADTSTSLSASERG